MPHKTRKKSAVWKKNPREVGQPPESAIVRIAPKTRWVRRNVSGLAIKKKMSAE